MSDRPDPERLFLKHLGYIEKVAAMACRKRGVGGDEADDFVSWIKAKLMEDDYARLRKFRGDAEFTTYLVTLVTRGFQEHQRELHGRWRPSAAAERLGPPAGELEQLVYRDGYSVAQAGEELRTKGRTSHSDIELARILAQLSTRSPLRPVQLHSEPALVAAQGSSRADDLVAGTEAEASKHELIAALNRAMDRLDPEDRLIVRMRYAEGYSVADVARGLKLDQKQLYRTVERLRKQLRKYLEDDGVSGPDVRGILDEDAP